MNSKAKNISTGGILVALTIIVLYLSLIIRINTLALLTLSSIFVPIAIIRSNLKTGVFVYIASSIIALFLIPIDTSILYILYFGNFGIIKFFIEKLNNKPFEIILKLAFSNIIFFIIYMFFKHAILNFTLAFPLWIFVILAQVFISLYDFAITLLITYYFRRFHNRF